MSKNKFIAELQGIGRLVHDSLKSECKIKGHTFIDFDFGELGSSKPSSPSW